MTSRTHRIPVLIISARFRFLLRSSFLLMFFFSLIFPSSQNSFCFSGKYYSFTGLTEIQPGLCSFYFSSKYRFCRVGFRQVKRNVRKPVTQSKVSFMRVGHVPHTSERRMQSLRLTTPLFLPSEYGSGTRRPLPLHRSGRFPHFRSGMPFLLCNPPRGRNARRADVPRF